MDLSERHALIIDRLRSAERVDVAELARAIGTSEVTIRRDLEQLAEQGVLRRVRGGAVSLLSRGEGPPFVFREVDNVEAKRRIGAAVAGLIQDGEAVVVDGGTTGLEVARALAGRRVTVMPLSMQAAGALANAAPTRIIQAGGEVRPGELAVTGPLAEAGLRALRFDTAVLSCCGASAEHGVTAYDPADASLKSVAISSAARTILAADAAKFARTAMAVVAPLTRVDVLVTDTAAPPEALEAIAALGIEVHRV
ncbi:DeoR/GlpR family DNA-binding transcription regulator [Spirillospora sp. NBC_01491]|uniref:DeoR/GlpR family DNA-binding transcription regulator n=1 Tax=Spirillospora sp. NBC_01491 TaxID=2976007 RepID=UPI002E3679AF|nr:DeoR/GlpR family DNA-binding transcription regulator [Spirillospora sp. NBC_01491]